MVVEPAAVDGLPAAPSWRGRWPAHSTVGVLATVLWSVLSLVRQHTVRTGVDLGIYTQAVSRYAHGQLPWSYVKAGGGFNLLGDHFTPVIAVIAPLYRVWPHPETLLLVQAALVGVSTAVISRTAREVLGGSRAAVGVGAAFALSWGVTGMALFDFHEVAFALPLLAVSLRQAIHGRWAAAVLWSAPLMLVKEDSAFLIAGLAISCWVVGQRRWAAVAGAYAVASFAVVVAVIIPWLSYSGRYTYWATTGHDTGLGHKLVGLVANAVWSIGSGQAVLTIGLALAAVWFLPVRSPLLWVAAPSLAARFTSSQPEYWGPHAHYNATLMVVVFMAALDAIDRRRVVFAVPAPRAKVRLSTGLVVTSVVLSAFTPLASFVSPRSWTCDARCHGAHQLAGEIPDGVSVAASAYLIDQIVDRTDAHLLNDTMTDSNGHGYYADYVIVDLAEPLGYDYGQRIQDFLVTHNYVPVDYAGGISLLMYDPAGAAIRTVPGPASVAHCRHVTGSMFCTSISWQPDQRPTANPPG